MSEKQEIVTLKDRFTIAKIISKAPKITNIKPPNIPHQVILRGNLSVCSVGNFSTLNLYL